MTLWGELAGPWQVCLDQAWAAYRAGSLPIGAAVVDREGRVVGRGRNRIFETLGDDAEPRALFGHRLAHAEINAFASVDHVRIDVKECALYTTLEPCALCVGAIRMLGVSDVSYAARDTAAGSLALLDATDFMRRGSVRVQHSHRTDLEAILIAMNVAAQLEVAERLNLRPAIDTWRASGLAGVEFGLRLFASGELRRLAQDPHTTAELAIQHLATSYGAGWAASSVPTPPPVAAAGACLPTLTPRPEARVPATRQCFVLILTGPPASGKSTIGRELAAALRVPFLNKDLFKEALLDSLGGHDRAWSARLGGASMALLFRTAQALLEAGQSVALESNFYAALNTPHFIELGQRYGCRFVQVVCTAPGPILVERFERRAQSGERHPGDAHAEALDEWRTRLVTQRWDALELDGPVFTVDTSERIDLERLVRSIGTAIDEPGSPVAECVLAEAGPATSSGPRVWQAAERHS